MKYFNSMGELSLIKASAGSGKTYNLTLKYLELLFEYENNYKRILAVTFTNKATEEMKSRIISQLNLLANNGNSDYEDYLIKKFRLRKEQLRNKSKNILSKILHDYSKFSISTIDSFFQQILKSFAKEINLQYGFTIELDSLSVLSEVIDNILDEISFNNELKQWILRYVKEKISSDGKVDVRAEINKLGSEIFKEVFANFNKNKIDKNLLDKFANDLYKIKNKFETDMHNLAISAIEYVKSKNISVKDFKYENNSFFGYFINIINKKKYNYGKRVIDAVDNLDAWFTKKSDKKNEIKAVYNVINDILKKTIEYYDNNIELYNSVNVSLKYFFTLGIVSDILKKLNEYTSENNLFLLSDTAKFINLIIDNNDVPFIYEKIGSIFKFYMIDEFQDTSELQWDNFKPLIDNSLADGNNNLIVGDIKQSIYRWRNGNWELLAKKVKNDFAHYNVNSYSLDTNWRSKKNIIEFNNLIFLHYPKLLQDLFNNGRKQENNDIVNAYNDSKQKISPKALNDKKKGYVSVEFIDAKKSDEYSDIVIAKLPKIIENLQDNNYQPKDIAILVRTKSEGEKIANYLLNYKNSEFAKSEYLYDVVSNEALLIKNSPAIKLIISVLKFFINKNDLINRAELAYNYNNFFNDKYVNVDFNDIFLKVSDFKEFYNLLPNKFKNTETQIKQLPLFELIEQIIVNFEINKNKNSLPFIISFNDFVSDFQSNKSSDLFSFLEYWDEKNNNIAISVSDSQNAIKILTIHKSKGLQFPAVIMPFVNWAIEYDPNKQPVMWCKSDKKPFDTLDFIPVRYSKLLSQTIFKDYYFNEKMLTFVDNLNLLYVGFTRAEEALFVMSRKSEKNELKHIGDGLLNIMIKNFMNNKKSDKDLYEIGKPESVNDNKKTYKNNNVILDSFSANKDINSILKIRHKKREFFGYNKLNASGILYHKIFENIIHENDISKVVNVFVVNGLINNNEKNETINKIKKLINTNNQTKQWFNNFDRVIVERDIITLDKKTKRPDRIVFKKDKIILIDYKFGNIEKTEYISQIKTYKNLLYKMGYKNISGKIWYVNKNKIVNV